eukprot:RCo011515
MVLFWGPQTARMAIPAAVLAMVVVIVFVDLRKATATTTTLNTDQLNEVISSEVRGQLLRMLSANSRLPQRKLYPEVKPRVFRKRILVTGGAGFVGSHLVDRLMADGHEVIVVDNFFTGRKRNVEHWIGHPNFELIDHDVTEPLFLQVDRIYHLACPASPVHYQHNPVKTIKTSALGTLNMLGLARRVKARMLLASTSEVYGDPQVSPQGEDYWGHVNPNGPRSCYDEGKRLAETTMYAYEKQENVSVRVARIFNTYGPRMHPHDGRVVSNFIVQALRKRPLTVYGDGMQTRSFQYVSDLVDGLIRLMESSYSLPVNLGNPTETTILDFAKYIQKHVNSDVTIRHLPAVRDDPHQRRPDITRAKSLLRWAPVVDLDTGIRRTVEYFREELVPRGLLPRSSAAGTTTAGGSATTAP